MTFFSYFWPLKYLEVVRIFVNAQNSWFILIKAWNIFFDGIVWIIMFSAYIFALKNSVFLAAPSSVKFFTYNS